MINKNFLRSAGLAAGLLGVIAFTPSAFAQYQEQGSFWNGATPTAPGPSGVSSPMYGGPAQYNGGWSSNFGGWAPTAAGNPGPFWMGAPQALGPGM